MKLPEFITIENRSHMRLEEDMYTTRGWDLPIKYVTKDLKIRGFMKHLNGKELTPITKEEFIRHQGEY